MVIGEFTSTATSVGRTKAGVGLATTAQNAGSFAAMRDASIDAGQRVRMRDRGASVIANNPQLQPLYARMPDDVQRNGFRLAVGTLASGEFSEAGMRNSLSTTSGERIGFDAGVAAFTGRPSAFTQSTAPASSGEADGGVPRVAIIGGAALVVGVAAFFVLRKR